MKIFEVSESDWWLASSAEEARNAAIEFYECDDEDYVHPIEKIKELSASEMQILTFYDDEQNVTRTFQEQFDILNSIGLNHLSLFATTEY